MGRLKDTSVLREDVHTDIRNKYNAFKIQDFYSDRFVWLIFIAVSFRLTGLVFVSAIP